MPTLRELHMDLARDTVLVFWALLFIEAPHTRYNFWRYQACLAAVTVLAGLAAVGNYDMPLWAAFLFSYLGMRLFFGLARYTPFAKPELFE